MQIIPERGHAMTIRGQALGTKMTCQRKNRLTGIQMYLILSKGFRGFYVLIIITTGGFYDAQNIRNKLYSMCIYNDSDM